MDETHPALDPTHRPRELDRIAAKRIARRSQARGLLGVGHHLFDLVELPRKPCGQAVRQQAEGGVAFRAVPASDLRPARGLARVGAVAGQRTAPVQVIGAALKPCIAPRLGPNVLLAGKPRVVAKLHRPWPGGGALPARADSSFVPRGAETTAPTLATPAVTMWTRPSDRAPSYGPCGQGLDKCCALAHPLPTLAALAPTASTLQQQRFMKKTTAPAGSRNPPSSQEIRLRNNQVKSHGRPTRESAKQHSELASPFLSTTDASAANCPRWTSSHRAKIPSTRIGGSGSTIPHPVRSTSFEPRSMNPAPSGSGASGTRGPAFAAPSIEPTRSSGLPDPVPVTVA